MAEIKCLTREEFRKMQLLQLDMIAELDRVCRLHDIKYTIICGTLLGAVRHKGYIPWDDDADIGMLREDYEEFKRHIGDLNPEICFFQDADTDSEYLWEYGKLRRTGTEYVRAGQEHIKCKTGVFIDIFPMDDIPKNVAGQIVQDIDCFFLRKILWSKVAKINSRGAQKAVYSMMSLIPTEYVRKRMRGYAKKSGNPKNDRARVLLFKSFGKLYVKNPLNERYGMLKEWFRERAEYEFEGHKFYGPKDYNAFLKYMYNDYMTLPPEEKREPHAPVSSYKF